MGFCYDLNIDFVIILKSSINQPILTIITSLLQIKMRQINQGIFIFILAIWLTSEHNHTCGIGCTVLGNSFNIQYTHIQIVEGYIAACHFA
jgi:hypothetical protein